MKVEHFWSGKRPSILLAEDDPDQSDVLKEVLEYEGFNVDTAFSGDAALHKLKTAPYQLGIFDVHMPGLSGETLLSQCRSTVIGIELPLIVVSAFMSTIEVARYRALGANACFSKPLNVDDLFRAVKTLMVIKK